MSGDNNEPRRARRRHLTVLFSDLCDSTALAASVDPEEFADLLEQLNQTFEQIIQRHGGTILQVRGDGVFAVFGLEAREDEGRRATEAAVELHAAVKNIRFQSPMPGFTELSMHSGIHSGLVLAVEGDQLLGRLVLVGDAANLASRLSDVAGRDEILVSDASLGAQRYFFDTSAACELAFSGVDEPLTVYPVLGRSTVNTHFEARAAGAQTAMIGRERDLNTLRNIYEQCASGRASTVSIIAPAGLGKTRLMEEFICELTDRDCRILRGYCESYLHAEPLQPLLQLFRQLLGLPQPIQVRDEELQGMLADRLSAIAPHLAFHAATLAAVLAPSASTAGASEETIVNAVSAIVQELASDQTLLVFIDDWQWADDLTRAVLRSTPALSHLKLLLVRSSREPIPDNQSSEIIELKPLETRHISAMIQALIPGVDQEVLQQVASASGGNPLFIEELCHAVTRGAAAPVLQERWHATQVPNYLSMLINSRIAQLTPDQQALLSKIAVLGNVIPQWLLASVVDLAESESAIDQLAELDLIYPGEASGSLRFKHGITREVVLSSLSPSDRHLLHLQVARDIEACYGADDREAILETLAYQYGETSEYDLAADYAEAAGDKALAASAMDRARLQFQAALRALDHLEEDAVYERWMAISKRLAIACLFDAEPDQCAIYQRAIDLARARNDLPNQTDGEYWLAYINYAMGEAAEAMIHIDSARASVEQLRNEPFKTQILATWGQIRANACDYDAALPALDEALARQKPFKHRPRVTHAYAYSLAARGMVLGDQGRFDEAFECFDEAEQLTEGPIHPTRGSILSMRAAIYLWQGRWNEAATCATRNVEIGDRMGSRYISAAGRALDGYARWHLGNKKGLEAMRQALSLVETHHQRIWTSMHFSWLAELLVKQGDYQQTRRCAVWVLKRARKLERMGESVAYCALAEIPADAEAATASTERCFARARLSAERRRSPRELALIDLKQATWLTDHRQPDRAQTVIEGCRGRFSEMGMYWYAAEAQHLEVRLNQNQGTN